MNTRHIFSIGVSLILSAATVNIANADSFTINDYTDEATTYWGGSIINNGSYTASTSDVLAPSGQTDDFAANSLSISRTDNSLSAVVTGSFFQSSYAKLIDIYSGDLFLSNNGWNPSGTPGHYATDSFNLGENWEYVLHIDNNKAANGQGTISLYQINNTSNIVTTDEAMALYNPTSYRHGQEYAYDPTGQTALGTGTWTILGDTLTFNLNNILGGLTLADFQLDGLIGAHWTMACGNDVIEGKGGDPVPEPTTMLLFGAGLVGLAGFRARRKK